MQTRPDTYAAEHRSGFWASQAGSGCYTMLKALYSRNPNKLSGNSKAGEKMKQYSSTQTREMAQDLKDGKILAFPTDTVYGVGCICGDLDALQRTETD